MATASPFKVSRGGEGGTVNRTLRCPAPPFPTRYLAQPIGTPSPPVFQEQQMDRNDTNVSPFAPSPPGSVTSEVRDDSARDVTVRPSSAEARQEPECLAFYHDYIDSMDEAEGIIKLYITKSGSYLLRKSNQHPYSITVVHDSSILHVHIQHIRKRYTLGGDQKFDTIGKLVKYYSEHEVPNSDRVAGLKLTIPIDKMDPLLTKIQREKGLAKLRRRPQQPLPTNQGDSANNLSPGSESNGAAVSNGGQPTPRRQATGGSPGLSGYFSQTGWGNAINEGYEMFSYMTDYESCEVPYYSTAKEDKNKLDQLLENLYKNAQPDNAVCECGLKVEEAELPCDFNFHISRQAETYGRIYFSSPHGETSWRLPIVVMLNLETIHLERLKRLFSLSIEFLRYRATYINLSKITTES